MILVHLVSLTRGQETCDKTNCKKTIGTNDIHYPSFTKTVDQKFASWTPVKSIADLSGTKEDRERQCTEACSKERISACKAAHLSPYDVAATSTCDLFAEDVYNHTNAESVGNRTTGWTTFHVKVMIFRVHSS